MDHNEGKASNTSPSAQPHHLSCTKCFDALWFCYSPFHQMQQYYRYGEFDNCFGKWSALADCFSLKTKRASVVQEILEEREKSKPHIWTYRTVEEASANWWRMYNRFYKPPPPSDACPHPRDSTAFCQKTKNIIVVGGLSPFVVGVYYYTMRAIGGTDELQVAIDKFEERRNDSNPGATATSVGS